VKFNVRIAERVNVGVSATVTLPSGNSDAVNTGIRRQAELFIKRYFNSLTIGDMVSLSQIEQLIKSSSDFIRGVTINSFTADGSELPLKDFDLNSARQYIAAGNVNVYAVIIGSSNY